MDEKELRARIAKADSVSETPAISESVVAQAPLREKRRFLDFRSARWSLAGAAAAVLAVGITLPQVLAPQPLFEMASSGGSQATGLRDGAAESSDKAAADMAMIWPGWIEYNHIPQGLSSDGGSGEIFEVRRVGNPEELLQRVATVFGVTGEPKEDEWSTDEFPSYSISGEDFSVNVWWSGPGGWSFNRWSDSWVGCSEPGIAEPEEADADAPRDGACVDEYQPTPELVPSEQEMLAQAEVIFTQLGIEFDQAQARVWRDDWGGSVSIALTLNGAPIPLESYIGWDGKGNLAYANGYAVEFVSRGQFDTISPFAAVERISDWRWFGGAASSFYEELYANEPRIGYADSVESAPAESSDDIAIDEPAVMPAPDEMPAEPEIIDVVIDRSVSALLSLYDAQGNMWLVPGYLLYNDQGWFDAIVAVEDGVIALPEPVDIMPLIDEPAIDTQIEPRS